MQRSPAAAGSAAARARAWVRAEALPLVALVLLMLVARSSFANHYHVPSGSMQPTLQPGDRIAVDMTAYGLRLPFTLVDLVPRDDPRPGDVVVFDSPVDGTRLVKRVVAVAGDTVELVDGRLRVDGTWLRPPGAVAEVERFGARLAELDLRDGGGPDLGPIEVPPGMALVLGDHRGRSADGRAFGLVPMRAFYGRALAVYHRRGDGFVWKRL
ncbi:signal peptidase I [Luteimonas sp. RD2P54]|uniref:Signal peptidase I n=1 Tax=Luteimonas endophytica TaxID=3042023 RepID=A0ABT6J5V2_9GAMM|nr:signal peptidase I [Luteimonas endophytica]MDH5822209.1 signal peptidase I [Luteimonas endophytica]